MLGWRWPNKLALNQEYVMKETSRISSVRDWFKVFFLCPLRHFRGVEDPEKILSQISPVYATKPVSLAK